MTEKERTLAKDTVNKVGETVILKGWVTSQRTHGKIVFIDLKDRSSTVQTVFFGLLLEEAKDLRDEYVVEIEGLVKARPENMVNPDLDTGTVEIEAKKLTILNTSKTPPFEINKDTSKVEEEVRLKYRYLDLRTERMQENIRLRSQFVQKAREYLFKKDFVESCTLQIAAWQVLCTATIAPTI
jgi:aspartyl-tRNA synthetase